MSQPSIPTGNTFTFPGTERTVNRMGYGAMQLAGKGVFGPPRDRAEAIAVLREAVETGVDHIDTSDFYGPFVTNQIIREALHPYPETLTLVTKVGALRGEDASWNAALGRAQLTEAIESNLRNLGLDSLPVVNLRVGPPLLPADGSIEEPFTVLAELQRQGKIQHLGVSTVSSRQVSEARGIAPIVCVQNLYNIAHRDDDDLLASLAEQGIAYVPYFPLGGFSPLQSATLAEIAADLDASPLQVALAWLLHRSPNVLLIPGTSTREHLRENLAAASLELSPETVAKLDAMGDSFQWKLPHA